MIKITLKIRGRLTPHTSLEESMYFNKLKYILHTTKYFSTVEQSKVL